MAINLSSILTSWQTNPPNDLAIYAAYLDIQDENGNTLLHLVLKEFENPSLSLLEQGKLILILYELNQVGYNYFIKNNQQQTAYTLMQLNPIHSDRLKDFNRDHDGFLVGEGGYFPDVNKIITQNWREFATQVPGQSETVIEFLSAREWPLDERRIYKISPNGSKLSIHDILVRTGQIEKLRALILMREEALARPFQPEAYTPISDNQVHRNVNLVTNGIQDATSPSRDDEINEPADYEQQMDFFSAISRAPLIAVFFQMPAFYQVIDTMRHERLEQESKQQYNQRLVQHAETNFPTQQQNNTANASGMFSLWMTPSEDSRSRLYKQVQLKNAFLYLESNDITNFLAELERLKLDPLITAIRSLLASKTLTYIENVLKSMPQNPHGGYLLDGITSLEDLILNNDFRRDEINTLAEYVNLGPHYCERLATKRLHLNI